MRDIKKEKVQGKSLLEKKQAAAITDDQDDENIGAVIKGIPNMASNSHDYVIAVADSPRLDNHPNRWKMLVVLMVITFVQEPVSALQDNCDTSWILAFFGSAVTACPPTHAEEVPIIRGSERVLPSGGMNHKIEILGTKQVRHQLDSRTTAMIKWDVATVRFPIANKVISRSSIHTSKTQTEKDVHWLGAKILNGKLDGKLLCAMDDAEMWALEDRAERRGPVANSSSTQPLNIHEALM